MPRRFIAVFLVFALLGYGSAWAFDGHALEAGEQAAGVHEHGQGAADEGDCDHCCHAASHMLGLTPPLPALAQQSRGIFRTTPGLLVITRFSSPPRKPPRS